MSVTLENIDQIMARTNVSYKEAKETLESCDGNVVDAILKLEENSEQKRTHQENEQQAKEEQKKAEFNEQKNRFMKQAKFLGNQVLKLVKKGLTIKVTWSNESKKLIELPLLIVLILTLWLMPFSLIALVAPLFFGIRMRLTTESGKTTDVNEWIQTHTNSTKDNQ